GESSVVDLGDLCLSSPTRETLCDLRDMPSLEACDFQLIFARRSRCVGCGECSCTVRSTATDLTHIAESGRSVRNSNDDHTVMEQRGMEAGNRRFLPAVLRCRTCKHAPNLAHERAPGP